MVYLMSEIRNKLKVLLPTDEQQNFFNLLAPELFFLILALCI